MGVADIDRALVRAREQVRELKAIRRVALAAEETHVPLKEAAASLRISERAARKRAQRGAGVKIDGKWTFSRAYVEGTVAKNVHLPCPLAGSR